LAGKSTLNRLELSRPLPSKYHKISHDPAAIADLFVTFFLEAHRRPPKQIVLDLDATDDPIHGHQEGRFFHGYYDCYCYLPVNVMTAPHCASPRRSETMPAIETAGGIDGRGGGFRGAASAAGVDG